MFKPEITPDSQKVLRFVLESGRIRGFELQKLSGLEGEQLVSAVQPLVASRVITASGCVNTDTIDRVNFAPLSGAYENSAFLLR